MLMLNQEAIYNAYMRPFSIVEKLNFKCGYEKSFKLMDRQLLKNRYLLGINVDDLDQDKWSFLCGQMDAPKPLIEEFTKALQDASLVLLGFEESDKDCIYKIYFEYWDKVKREMLISNSPCDLMTLFRGFKWSVFDNSKIAVTHYKYHPMLTVEEVIKRVHGTYSLQVNKTSFETAKEIISHLVPKKNSASLRYLEASEENNPRMSFDVNLYKTNVRLGKIYPYLKKLCCHYSIQVEEFDEFFSQVSGCVLGHLSGGIDREGRSFLTIYYETSSVYE